MRFQLKTVAVGLVLLWATAFVTARPARAQDGDEQTQKAPKITLKVGDVPPKLMVSGWWKEKVPEARKKGRVYVIDFWASWWPAVPRVHAAPARYAGQIRRLRRLHRHQH